MEDFLVHLKDKISAEGGYRLNVVMDEGGSGWQWLAAQNVAYLKFDD